jgi:hypothetical protein
VAFRAHVIRKSGFSNYQTYAKAEEALRLPSVKNWTTPTLLMKFEELRKELMEKLIAQEFPTDETLSRIPSEILKQLGLKPGHIMWMKNDWREILGIPNHHLNPEPGQVGRISLGSIRSQTTAWSGDLRQYSSNQRPRKSGMPPHGIANSGLLNNAIQTSDFSMSRQPTSLIRQPQPECQHRCDGWKNAGQQHRLPVRDIV